MGFSESSFGCKKHPHQQEKQGVCPSCLRERLSRLCSASHKELASRVAPSCSSSLSFSPTNYSSAKSSTSASPARRQGQQKRSHKRNGSELMGLSSLAVKVGKGLKKSRSIAFVPRNFGEEDVKNGNNKKKGFWSKLLSFKAKKDVLTHSSSMRIIGKVF